MPPELLGQVPFAALRVCIGGRWYLLPVASIEEVVALPAWELLPDAPPWVLGTLRYGRQIVPLIDAQRRIADRATTIDAGLRVLIVKTPELAALLVDAVGDVVTVLPGDISHPQEGIRQADYLLGAVASPDATTFHILRVASLARGRADRVDG